MREHNQLYIDGAWRDPLQPSVLEKTDPATGKVTGRVVLGGEADVDAAVAAAERAFASYSQTTPQERIALVERILVECDNDSPFGLASYVTSADRKAAHASPSRSGRTSS